MIGPALMVAALLLAGALYGFVKWDERHGFPSLVWRYEHLVAPVVLTLCVVAVGLYVLGGYLWISA